MPELEDVNGRLSPAAEDAEGKPTIGSYLGTVALVGLGVALIEEELLAGMAIGVAAMAAPGLIPKLGRSLRPLLKSAVRAGYNLADRTKETVAEMSEQFQDVVAEVKSEHEHAIGVHTDGGGAVHPATPPAGETAEAEHNRPRKAGKSGGRGDTE